MESQAGQHGGVNAALADVRSRLVPVGAKTRIDARGKVPLSVLEGVRQNLGTIARKAARDNATGSGPVVAGLAPVRDAIHNALRANAPDFDAAYLMPYRAASEPVDTQSTLQEFLDRIDQQDHNADKKPTIREADTRKLLADIDHSEFGISPEAKKAVHDVHNSLLQGHTSNVKVGSANAQPQHLHFGHGMFGLLQHGDPYRGIPGAALPILGGTAGGFIGNQFHHPVIGAEAGMMLAPGVGAILARRLVPRIGERAANAALAGEALQRANAPSLLSRVRPLLPITPWLVPAAAGSAVMQSNRN